MSHATNAIAGAETCFSIYPWNIALQLKAVNLNSTSEAMVATILPGLTIQLPTPLIAAGDMVLPQLHSSSALLARFRSHSRFHSQHLEQDQPLTRALRGRGSVVWRSRIAGGAFRVAFSQSCRFGRGDGQAGCGRSYLAVAWLRIQRARRGHPPSAARESCATNGPRR